MAAKNSNKSKLAQIKKVYQHVKEKLYFSNPAKFQHFRCNTSWENVSWKLTNLQTFVLYPSHTNVCKFFNFSLTFSQLILHLKCWNFWIFGRHFGEGSIASRAQTCQFLYLIRFSLSPNLRSSLLTSDVFLSIFWISSWVLFSCMLSSSSRARIY